jgi:hypothetical protein
LHCTIPSLETVPEAEPIGVEDVTPHTAIGNVYGEKRRCNPKYLGINDMA